MDILDEQDRLIPGTRKIHLFAYEFVPPPTPEITVSDSVEEAL
jgi:hypothetical protein